MKRFNIFIKSNKFNWSANKIALVLFAILFVTFQFNKNIESQFKDSIDKYIGIVGLIVFISGTLYRFSRFAKPQKLNGQFVGFLEFKKDSIIIDQEQYKIEEIEKINIVNNDFYGKGTGSGRGFDSNLSNGVDNYLTLIFKDKSKVTCMFEIYYKEDIRKLDEILIVYYSLGKIDFNQLTTILNLKSYEIEDIKKLLSLTQSK